LFFFLNYRAIDVNGLIGYIGGYVGLILGFSLLQIPQLISLISRHLKKNLTKRSCDESNDNTQVNVEEASCENINGGSTTTSEAKPDFKYVTEL